MIQVHTFTFNDFQENTYVLSDETGECIIIDPGCFSQTERDELTDYINASGLKPVKLVNTHCHIDHVLGNYYVSRKYDLVLYLHEEELLTYEGAFGWTKMIGISLDPMPEKKSFLTEGDTISFGNSTLQILFTPGHSIASLSFYSVPDNLLISGDVLFRESIGRTDLPGGNFETLMQSIKSKLYSLPDSMIVYPGHGPETTIAHEKKSNPFTNRF